VLFSTHIVSDLERVASDVLCLHGHRIVLAASTDDLKETHGILRLSAEAASFAPGALPGELSRRRRDDGGVNIVLNRRAGALWPALAAVTASGDDIEVPGLEDLIIELTS
jgi:ABC-2 type transport system ATP-binding protein